MLSRDLRRVSVAGLEIDLLSESEVVGLVLRALSDGVGGWVVTPNVDIARQCARDPGSRALVGRADVVVADGVPLRWLARLGGTAVPDRVAGSSLIRSLTRACAERGRSVYLLGGETGVPDRAAEVLRGHYPQVQVAGTDAPPMGFDARPAELSAAIRRVRDADPAVVFVGLGFPRQERLIERLQAELPGAWFVGCGAAIAMTAGVVRRAPAAMQRAGLEWLYRLLLEPRRLAGRYLRDDLPYLAGEAARTLRRRARG